MSSNGVGIAVSMCRGSDLKRIGVPMVFDAIGSDVPSMDAMAGEFIFVLS
jgi:hypothetical protein